MELVELELEVVELQNLDSGMFRVSDCHALSIVWKEKKRKKGKGEEKARKRGDIGHVNLILHFACMTSSGIQQCISCYLYGCIKHVQLSILQKTEGSIQN